MATIEQDLYNYLSINLLNYNIFYGNTDDKVDADKTIQIFRINTEVNQNNPTKFLTHQISVRSRDIETARTMSDEVINLFRGYSGQLVLRYLRVLSIRDLGDQLEEEGRIVHIPIEMISYVVE